MAQRMALVFRTSCDDRSARFTRGERRSAASLPAPLAETGRNLDPLAASMILSTYPAVRPTVTRHPATAHHGRWTNCQSGVNRKPRSV